jgi:HAD superfamily hydrolase (TIGR01484 family)
MKNSFSSKSVKLIAMDLDGTITQHKSKIELCNKVVLEQLDKKFQLVIIGAGSCMRIYKQLDYFPIDVIGYYGMQSAKGLKNGEFRLDKNNISNIKSKSQIIGNVDLLRELFGYTEFSGESVEFHESGMFTIPLLGTNAKLEDKLKFDPFRERRRKVYSVVRDFFSDYTVFIGGTSSFDIVPKPYNKLYALNQYAKELEIEKDNIIFIGDDYGLGGNDEQVYKSEIPFICIDNYMDFRRKVIPLL